MNFNKFNGIILSEGTEKRNVDNQLISEDRNNEIEIIKIQEWFNIFHQRNELEIINNELIKKIELNIRKNKINYSFLIKRIFEFIFTFVFLIISSPLLIIASILIYMEDKGPIFYSQLRVGKNGIPFTIWKLRSMKVNAEKNGVKGN